MKFILCTLLGSLSLITALPAPDVSRFLPTNWQYKISSLHGPGCPDFGIDPEAAYTTRLTFGQNTMDGSEIYYWFIAYPHLRVDLDGAAHSWCETELSYQEFSDLEGKVESEDYRLRLHKNGTRVIATYDLEKGVKATFKAEYSNGRDTVVRLVVSLFSLVVAFLYLANTNLFQATDTVTWTGPLASGQYQKEDSSPVSADDVIYKLPKCGAGKIKFRTDLYIEGKSGLKGYVQSEHRKDAAGVEQYYGVQQGFSYDWEKCGK
jgi:hypothetical protein